MNSLMNHLHEEHAHLMPQIEAVGETRDLVGEAPTPAVLTAVAGVHRFLTTRLLPHADLEELVLYPVVARLMGAADPTADLSRDHVEIRRLTDELRKLLDGMGDRAGDPSQAAALRGVLHALYVLITTHFAKEERVYPLLERRLSPEEAHQLYVAMMTGLVAGSGQ
ncbi:MAG TPA: hemerythrin domain-containing protein [Pilimelia sp.]|nr:hemerythrin domain-containing protein [Pilimelia sp.]